MKRIKDPDHLRRVAEMPCCVCGLEGSTNAHHLLKAPGKGLGLKAWDCYVVPLCFVCHDKAHRAGTERKMMAKAGIHDANAYALGLYYGRDDYEPFETDL